MESEAVQQLEAGRELDALVAEQVMGWKGVTPHRFADGSWSGKCPRSDGGDMVDDLPNYSTDIASAWQIVEAMHVSGDCISLSWLTTLDGDEWGWRWQAEFRRTGSYAIATTPALAICRAALIATCRIGAPAPRVAEGGRA